MAKHSTAGAWGIFEAKGGGSTLSSEITSRGTQMSARWIGNWLEEIAQANNGIGVVNQTSH